MMAAPKPPDNGRKKQHSFAQILNVSKPNPQSIIQPVEKPTPETFIKSNLTMVKGKPAFLLLKEEDEMLAAPFKFCLIGKFSKGRPKMEYLWNKFNTIGYKASFSLRMIDHRHILIYFDLEEDFQRCWIKGLRSFDHHIMRVLKWTPRFKTEQESSITPVSVSFEGLLVHRFNEEYLRKLSSIIGQPLKIDAPTLNMSRPSIFRACVEVDLLHELPKRILLGTDEYSYYQHVTYENLPEYCMDCRKIGHSSHNFRHGKAKEAPVKEKERPVIGKEKENSVSQPANKTKPPSTNPTWKTKKAAESVTGQETNQHKDESSSGLTAAEKMNIPTYIGDSSPMGSQDKRFLSKEKLSAILEKSLQEENLKNTWEEDDMATNHETKDRQLIEYKKHSILIPPSNLSSRFDILAKLIMMENLGLLGETNVIQNLEEYEGFSQQDMGAIDEFNDFINNCNMLEFPLVGNLYTWKGTRQAGRVLKRLDRLLFTQEWLSLFPVALVHHLNRSTSDHAPLLLQYKVDMDTKPRIFRFQKMWFRRSSFFEVVKENWDQPIEHQATTAGLTVVFGVLLSNLEVYLIEEFNIKRISAAQICNLVTGLIAILPTGTAVLADSFLSCYTVIWISSLISEMGMLLLTLTATFSKLRPPKCENDQSNNCTEATKIQLTVLYLSLALAVLGMSGTRFTLGPMGAHQFNEPKNHGIFFNWYVMVMNICIMLSSTAIVYVQNNVSWAWGFGISAAANIIAVLLFFLGTKFYRQLKPQGSPFAGLAHVLVTAFRNRGTLLSQNPTDYHQESRTMKITPQLCLSNFSGNRFLNRAALKTEGDTEVVYGSKRKSGQVCTVTKVEDLKSLIKLLPLLASAILFCVAYVIQTSMGILQALTMERNVGHNFEIPAATIVALLLASSCITILFVDRILFPMWNKFCRRQITPLQRIGIGHLFYILSMVVLASVEAKRLKISRVHNPQEHENSVEPMSIFLLVPPLVLTGVAEAFHFPGHIEFYYQEFPQNLRNTSSAMISLFYGVAYYIANALIHVVRRSTDWLPDNINKGRLDNVYWLMSVLVGLNFCY
ncbi:OLC1v1004090C1 [Oldenlandia corymbosa var. corymbosa]|uniref:OLC1v1004090C1 n=1 Tax=Oldenlandia corymbosa var. corymbosa TaxID=529605 RepID=A0AAV1DBF8_OLDCO|nr:OLC1v1004090C1 [Oldenlandia corymbosa var. corymbosa]